jgi:hypothetical protein
VASSREVIEFTTDDLDPALAEMGLIGRARNGWVNIRPRPVDDPEEFMSEFAPREPPSFLGGFGRRKPITVEGTWIPGRSTRRAPEPASVGLEHPAGRFAVRQLADGGSSVPSTWKVVNDNTRRGLVLSVPAGDDLDADCETILAWLVAAAGVLAPDQVTGLWQAEVHRR